DNQQFTHATIPYADPDGTGPKTASPGPDMVAYLTALYPTSTPDGSIRLQNIAQARLEECEDNNTSNTDACVKYNAVGNTEVECIIASCGDNFTKTSGAGPNEQCDDGDNDNNDACLTTCVTNVCGDGWRRTTGGSVEACDDGNTDNDDACV